MMTTREYKNTGDQISLLGFGCMRLPKIDPEKYDVAFFSENLGNKEKCKAFFSQMGKATGFMGEGRSITPMPTASITTIPLTPTTRERANFSSVKR